MISKISNKLQGTFAERAPKELVEKEQDKLKEYQDKKQFLQEQLEFLN